MHDRHIEAMPRADLDRLRLHLLRRAIRHASERSAHFKAVLKGAGVDVSTIKKLDDIRRIPPMSRFELGFSQASWPPYGDLLCVDEKCIVATVMSAGNMGRPVLVPLTENDASYHFAPGSDQWHRAVNVKGLGKDALVMSTVGHSPDAWSGSMLSVPRKRPGVPVVLTGGATPLQQLRTLERIRPSVLVTGPDMCDNIRSLASELPSDRLERIRLKAIVVGGSPGRADLEPWDFLDKEPEIIEAAWAAETGLIGHECSAHEGLHVPEDMILVEVLDEEGEPVTPGQRGELVVTTLRREAFPLIRYRLGDLTAMEHDPCPCGRTHVRIRGFLGKAETRTPENR